MTQERYLDMCEQLGREPDPEKMPPDWTDLPFIAQEALTVFNTLGDRLAADIGYLGKDYTLLPIYLEGVDDKELFLEILAWMDDKLIRKSSEDMKRAREQVKRTT